VVGGGGVELEGDGKVYVHHKPMGEVKVARWEGREVALELHKLNKWRPHKEGGQCQHNERESSSI
jgi:hypothetical protein